MAAAFVRALPAAGTLGVTANTNFSTSFDATGCTAMIVGVVMGESSGDVTADSITAITYNSVTLGTPLVAKTMANASTSAAFYLYGLMSPTTGSNTLAITTNTSVNIRTTVGVAGYSGVASFGNTASTSDGNTADSATLNLNCAVGNTGVGFACHGSNITTVDQTLLGVVNNYDVGTALNCLALIESAGVGASTPFSANSAASDKWGLAAVELVATATVAPGQLMQPVRSAIRLA